MELLRTKGQVGYLPTMSTDAKLSKSVMAYQNHEILFGSCGGHGSISVRLEGSRSRASPGAKNEPAQRDKVRSYPRFTKATHIAVPARYTVGEFPTA